MDCDQCKTSIDDYIENRLGKEESIVFEQHLRECKDCAELLRLEKFSSRVITYEKALSPGYFFTEKVMAGIQNFKPETEPALVRILRPALRPALVTISLAAAILAGVLVGNVSRPSERKVPVELSLMNDTEIEFLEILAID